MICRQGQEVLSKAQNGKGSRYSLGLFVYYIQNAAELQAKNVSRVYYCLSWEEDLKDAQADRRVILQ